MGIMVSTLLWVMQDLYHQKNSTGNFLGPVLGFSARFSQYCTRITTSIQTLCHRKCHPVYKDAVLWQGQKKRDPNLQK